MEDRGYIDLSSMRPWWLRLLLLVAIGGPLIYGGALPIGLRVDHAISDLATWTAYSLFVWLFVFLCVGPTKLLKWIGVGAIFGLTLALGGAVVSKIGVWQILHYITQSTPAISEEELATRRSLDLLFRMLMITSTLPFFFLSINSFPASDLFFAAVRTGSRRGKKAFIYLAVFLRLFQHVFELFTKFLLAWEEENPRMLVPRHQDDVRGSPLWPIKMVPWWKDTITVWSLALLIHSLLFVPVAVKDWQHYLDENQLSS